MIKKYSTTKEMRLAIFTFVIFCFVAAQPAQAFWGACWRQGKLRKAWNGVKEGAEWVNKKVENGKNQERGRARGH